MWDGPLSQWPAHAELQRRYFNRASDAYYIDVLEVRRLREPRLIFTRRDGSRGRIVNIQLRPSSMLFEPCGLDGRELVSVGGGAPDCQAQCLAGWPALPDTIMALQVAWPIASAVFSGSWTKLVLLGRWSGSLWPSFPRGTWRVVTSGQQERIREGLVAGSSAERWAEAANALRRWAPAVLASQHGGPGSADFLATRSQLEDLVSSMEIHTEVADEQSRRAEVREQRRWGSAELLIFWQAAALLKNMRALPEAVRMLSRAASAAIPAALAMGRHPHPPDTAAPSAATLGRLSFAVDIAAMLLARTNARPGATRYGWADSSPQGGRDWLLSKVSVVPGDVDLCDLHDAARTVASLSDAPAPVSDSDSNGSSEDVEAAGGDLEQRRGCFQKLQAGLSEHVFPPVALGLRQSDLAHKCAAFVHCVALEVSPTRADLEEALRSVVSFTTDLGTELGMSGFRVDNLSGLLPEWLQQPFQMLVADGEAHEQVAVEACEVRRDVEGDVDAVSVAGLVLEADGEVFEAPSAPRARRSAARGWQDRAGGDDEPRDDAIERRRRSESEQPAPAAASGDGRADAGIFMPSAIPVPGMLHILSNLLEDVDSHMAHWDVFWKQLKNAAALLCDSMRLERMIALCFPGPLSVHRSAFSSKIPVPYSKRWGSVTFF